MDSSNFGKLTSAQAKTLTYYFNGAGQTMVVRETMRFIQTNFEQQGWHGASFVPWKANKKGLVPILHRSGDLQGGFNYDKLGNGDVLFYNNIAYARVHNEGFKGQVTIPAHVRLRFGRADVYNVKSHRRRMLDEKVEIGKGPVLEHTRKVVIDQRQFAPTGDSPSPILEADIVKWLEHDIKNILTL